MSLNIKVIILKSIIISMLLLPLNLSASTDGGLVIKLKKSRIEYQVVDEILPAIIERDFYFNLDERTTFFPLVESEDDYNHPCLIPDIEGLKNPILNEILRVLNLNEHFEPKTQSGSFGIVRLSETLAVKAFRTEYPDDEINWLMKLRQSHYEEPIAGFDICLPIAVFRIITYDPLGGSKQAPLAVFPRVNASLTTKQLLLKAVVGDDFDARCCIFQMGQAIGRMQSHSMRDTGSEKGLVADAHSDMNPNNIISKVSAKHKFLCNFTLIDTADFRRGNSQHALPVSVDITYNFLFSLKHIFAKLRSKGLQVNITQERNITLKTAWLVYLGYFSAFNADQLKQLEPIYTTMKAYDLHATNTYYGKKLFAGDAPEVAINRGRYELAFDIIRFLSSAARAGLAVAPKFSGINYQYPARAAACLYVSEDLLKSTDSLINHWNVERKMIVAGCIRMTLRLLSGFKEEIFFHNTISHLSRDLDQLDLLSRGGAHASLLFPGIYSNPFIERQLITDPKGIELRKSVLQKLLLIEIVGKSLGKEEQENILALRRLIIMSMSYKYDT